MPTTSPSTSIDGVRQRLQDESLTNPSLGDAEIDQAIQTAVSVEYSRHRPLVLSVDLTGAGALYTTADMTGWSDGFSWIESVEYPACDYESGERPIHFLDDSKDWELWTPPDGVTRLLLRYVEPQSTETVRVQYSVPRTHTTGGSTVLAADLPAVLDLATSIACGMLATAASGQVDDSIGASAIDRGRAAARWEKMISYWYNRYLSAMGIGPNAARKPVARTHDVDIRPDFSYRRIWLTHGRRR